MGARYDALQLLCCSYVTLIAICFVTLLKADSWLFVLPQPVYMLDSRLEPDQQEVRCQQGLMQLLWACQRSVLQH